MYNTNTMLQALLLIMHVPMIILVSNSSVKKYIVTVTINPLSPDSDHRQISPCNIDALLIREVMRIQDMIIKDELC